MESKPLGSERFALTLLQVLFTDPQQNQGGAKPKSNKNIAPDTAFCIGGEKGFIYASETEPSGCISAREKARTLLSETV